MNISSRGKQRRVRYSLIAPALLWIALMGGTAHADVRATPGPGYTTDGRVDAIVPTSSAIYIGGGFDRIAPPTGPGLAFNAATGTRLPWPQVVGRNVSAAVPDGSGGFYVGGYFDRVGDQAQSRLVHLLPDGTVDPDFDVPVNGVVYALALAGHNLYVGGGFSQVQGQYHTALARVDVTTGTVSSWDPGFNYGSVKALDVANGRIYAGGQFRYQGTRRYVAAIATSNGHVTGWHPHIGIAGKGYNTYVDAVAVSGAIVYMGGNFRSINGADRWSIGAVDAATGAVTPWNPDPNGGAVRALALSGSTVYAGGSFATIGGATRTRVAALDAVTGDATAWNAHVARVGSSVNAIAISGGTIYLGGTFTSVGSKPRRQLAAVDATTGQPTSWHVQGPNGPVDTVAVSGSTIYAGGHFSSAGGVARENLAALNPDTGQPLPWNPGVDDWVRALAVHGNTVYVGGRFTSVDGQPRQNIAAVNGTTGGVTPWDPGATGSNAYVDHLAVSGTGATVYASGQFNTLGGASRNSLGGVDAITGAATGWDPQMRSEGAAGYPDMVEAFGSTLYVGGLFDEINGEPRGGLAAFNADTAQLTAWNPLPPGSISSRVSVLDRSGSSVYVSGWFDSIGGATRHDLAAVNASTGTATSWNPDLAYGYATTLAAGASEVYAGGFIDPTGPVPFRELAAIDATTGQVTGWDPNPVSDRGPVSALALAPDGSLWVGGYFWAIGNKPEYGLARFAPSP